MHRYRALYIQEVALVTCWEVVVPMPAMPKLPRPHVKTGILSPVVPLAYLIVGGEVAQPPCAEHAAMPRTICSVICTDLYRYRCIRAWALVSNTITASCALLPSRESGDKPRPQDPLIIGVRWLVQWTPNSDTNASGETDLFGMCGFTLVEGWMRHSLAHTLRASAPADVGWLR
jgi:hypothetical protein